MNGDMKMELHFVCNLAFIFASLSVTKYIMKVCHSLFVESYDEVLVEISSARLCHLLFARYLSLLFAKVYHSLFGEECDEVYIEYLSPK